MFVVTRGGGSREDLAAFDDEWLARWVATSPVPVLSAVGHQVDATMIDLVADAVAPTPSAAAVAVLPDGAARAQRVDEAATALQAACLREIERRRQQLEALRMRLRSPAQRLEAARLGLNVEDINQIARLQLAMDRQRQQRRSRLVALRAQLDALSPLGVLDRGYAIVHGPKGVVRDPSAVSAGDGLRIRLAGGEIDAEVR